MNTSIELYSRLRDYLDGRISPRDLEDWLAPRFGLVASMTDTDLNRTAATIELCIADVQAGVRTERSAKMFLRKRFADVLRTSCLEYRVVPPVSVVGQCNPVGLRDSRLG